MSNPPLPADDVLLNAPYYGFGLQECIETARDLGEQPADRYLAEARLLRAFARSIPESLRAQIEISLLRLRGGLEEDLGNRVIDGEIQANIYKDVLNFAPMDGALAEILKQAHSWRESETAIQFARYILRRAPSEHLCASAVNVLYDRQELDPSWYLNYFSTYCVEHHHGNDEPHLTPLLRCIDTIGEQEGWDALRRREEVMNRVRPVLKKKSWAQGLRVVMDWLVETGPQAGLLELFHEFFANPRIAYLVPPYIAILKEEARDTLTAILEGRLAGHHKDDYYRLPAEAVEPSLEAGLAPAEILNALARNPNSYAVGNALLHIAELNGATGLQVSRRDLPARAWSYLEECVVRHACLTLFGRLESVLQRHSEHPGEVSRLLRQIYDLRLFESNSRFFLDRFPQLNLLWSKFNLRPSGSGIFRELFKTSRELDFNSLTGLILPKPIKIEYDDTLRFQYLLEYGRTETNASLRALMADLTGRAELERLIKLEQERDEWVDVLSNLYSELETQPRREEEEERYRRRDEAGGLRPQSEEWRDEPEMSPVERRIIQAERYLNGDHFAELREASASLIPALVERGVTFVRWEPEGLLGEFRPPSRTATIYTGMIRVLAGSPLMRSLGGHTEVEESLRTIAEIHEAMHGHVILATTCDGHSWEKFADSSYCLHEAIVNAYTHLAVERMDDNSLLAALLKQLESLLPPEYKGAAFLKNLSPEDLRRFLLAARDDTPASTMAETVAGILSAIRSEAGLLAALMGEADYRSFQDAVSSAAAEILNSTSESEFIEACCELFRRVEAEASWAVPLLENHAGVSWPDELTEAYWLITAACPLGPVGRSSLRLRIDWIGDTPGLSALAGYSDITNSASLGLPNFEEAAEAAGLSPDDPSLRLLKERILPRQTRPRGARKRAGDRT